MKRAVNLEWTEKSENVNIHKVGDKEEEVYEQDF